MEVRKAKLHEKVTEKEGIGICSNPLSGPGTDKGYDK